MEGSKYRKTGWFTALGSTAILVLGATQARAELVHGAVPLDETIQTPNGLSGAGTQKKPIVCFVAHGSAQPTKISHAREDWHAVVHGMRSEWEALKREAVEAAVTMFFIKGGTPPNAPPPPSSGNPTPPGQSNNPPGGNLPPPGGNGETPPGDPGNPPNTTPEPASLVIALLGAGLAAGCGWRRGRLARKES